MELYPAVLKSEGLISALRWSGDQIRKRTGVTTTLLGGDPDPRLPLTVVSSLLRASLLCLSNVGKHARAHTATIKLDTEPRRVRLTTMDDGIGFNACIIPRLGQEHGWGTQIMRERLAAVGGRLLMESVVGQGTRIIVEVPR